MANIAALLLCTAALSVIAEADGIEATSAPTVQCVTAGSSGNGGPKEGTPCSLPFTYTNGNGKVDVHTFCRDGSNEGWPYGIDHAQFPKPGSGAMVSHWCATVDDYNPNDPDTRLQWGFCKCVNQNGRTKFPTAKPTNPGELPPEPTHAPSIAPTGTPTTPAPTYDVSFWKACKASGGWYSSKLALNKEKNCKIPFKYKGKTYNSCLRMDEIEPNGVVGGGGNAPNNGQASLEYWCPTKSPHDGTFYGRRWGYCACNWNTKSPTKQPTLRPTKSPIPTAAPVSTFAPTTMSPTKSPTDPETAAPTRGYGVYNEKPGGLYECYYTSTPLFTALKVPLEECKLSCDDHIDCVKFLFNENECRLFQHNCKKYKTGSSKVYTRVDGVPRTKSPTSDPTEAPTMQPTISPTMNPTENPTGKPTEEPTMQPTISPTMNPTENPTVLPTAKGTRSPRTNAPTPLPTEKTQTSSSPTATGNLTDAPTVGIKRTNTTAPTNIPTGSPSPTKPVYYSRGEIVFQSLPYPPENFTAKDFTYIKISLKVYLKEFNVTVNAANDISVEWEKVTPTLRRSLNANASTSAPTLSNANATNVTAVPTSSPITSAPTPETFTMMYAIAFTAFEVAAKVDEDVKTDPNASETLTRLINKRPQPSLQSIVVSAVTMVPPTAAPTLAPTATPTASPTQKITASPTTNAPTVSHVTETPTASVTWSPTLVPSAAPTASPTLNPTVPPTNAPTLSPHVNQKVRVCKQAVEKCNVERKTYSANVKKIKAGKFECRESENSNTSIVVGVILGIVGLSVPLYMIQRERSGRSVFANSNYGSKKKGSAIAGTRGDDDYDIGTTTAESSSFKNTADNNDGAIALT